MSATFKKITKIIKIIWLLIGILILGWTGYWYYQLQSLNYGLGIIAIGILFSLGIYLLAIYIPLTVLLLIIYFILKTILKKKKML